MATIFMIINLNAVMGVIFNVPAAMASTVRSHNFIIRCINFFSSTVDRGFARGPSAL